MRRVIVFLAVLVLSLGVVCNVAYAEGSGGGGFGDEVIYGPSVYNVAGQTYCVQVYAGNNLNAALTALGYDPYDSRFTSDVKAYLSDSTYGGSFFEFAQQFTNNNSPTAGMTIYTVSYTTALSLNNNLYGAEYVFGASYTQQLYDAAKQRVEDVLAGNIGDSGGGSGGGSGGDESGDYFVFECKHNSSYITGVDRICVPKSMFAASPNSNYSASDVDAGFIRCSVNSSYINIIYIVFVKDGSGTTTLTDDGTLYKSYTLESGTYLNASVGSMHYTIDDNKLYVNNTGTTNFSRGWITPDSYPYTLVNPNNGVLVGGPLIGSGSGSGSEPTVPPTNWPDPPNDPTPTPPDVPEPDPPVTPDPPTDPTPPSDPVYPIQPIYNTSNFTVDLQGILDALDEHCQHLQNALYTDLKNFYDNLTSKMTNDFTTLRTFLSGQVSWLGETLTDSMDALQDYLYDLFHWLADELDFTVTGGEYNDSTVVSWLKKIYSKLGGGTNTKPIDPVSDPFDFGQWLYELWQNFVLDLLALGRNGLAEIAYSLGELIHKFPFSIPWDIAAMLGLLVAEPVTPVINFPMFYYTGSSVQIVQTRVDLSPYNNYVEPVRVMIKIGFAFVLAWRTKDMMELLTMARGGKGA